jgi:phosphatidylserine/phosphatidylglycerophosphate/cardiolipin synthase-like enzyme
MEVEQIYQWLIQYLETNESMTEAELRKTFDTEDVEHALLLLNYLVTKNLASVKVTGIKREYSIKDIDQAKILIGYEQPISIEVKPAHIRPCLVISVPLSLEQGFRSLKKKYQKLQVLHIREAFKLLLSAANRELLLLMPFFESDGLSYLVDEVQNVGKREVTVRLLSREILSPRREDFAYLNKLRAFSKLINLFESNRTSPKAKLEIRDYSARISDQRGDSLHYEGVHQKMIVTDRRYAYVGSGEIRSASFITNGEVGVIQLDEEAEFWADFFDLFWESAQPVQFDFFKSAIM